MSAALARLRGITKRFGSVTALRGAELLVGAGEVHAVLGENGAGKTTLLGVLAGMVHPDAGTLEIGGRALMLRDPREAWAAGIGMVHQHFTLVPALSVLENLALGRRPGTSGWRLPRGLRAEVERLMERTALHVPLDARVGELGVGSLQRIEILKALLRSPRVLVLDEPTAVLAPSEVDALFGLLRELAAGGSAVVLVTHKLDEALAVADRVTVLRGGATVLTAPAAATGADALVLAMVGERESDAAAVGHGAGRRSAAHVERDSAIVAEVRDARVRGRRGEWALDGVSLAVRRAEIVGVAGVEGNGQRELALVLAGTMRPDEGSASISPGVGFVPQDRTREGLVPEFDVTSNVALAFRSRPEYRRGPLMRWDALRARTGELMRSFNVRASGPGARVATLSGGNQQRVVVSRELAVAADLLVAENPTRGLDVAASAFVHRELQRLSADPTGPGVVLISTDLDEVLALSDKVFVMVRGRLLEVPGEERTRSGVGARMLAGVHA